MLWQLHRFAEVTTESTCSSDSAVQTLLVKRLGRDWMLGGRLNIQVTNGFAIESSVNFLIQNTKLPPGSEFDHTFVTGTCSIPLATCSCTHSRGLSRSLSSFSGIFLSSWIGLTSIPDLYTYIHIYIIIYILYNSTYYHVWIYPYRSISFYL